MISFLQDRTSTCRDLPIILDRENRTNVIITYMARDMLPKAQRIRGRRNNSSCTHGDGHLVRWSGTKQLYCRLCRSNWAKKHNEEVKKLALDKLGAVCVCCGSTNDLTFDHIVPQIRRKPTNSIGICKEVLNNPESFQILCGSCNRWKNNGPWCPCKLWRASGWITPTERV